MDSLTSKVVSSSEVVESGLSVVLPVYEKGHEYYRLNVRLIHALTVQNYSTLIKSPMIATKRCLNKPRLAFVKSEIDSSSDSSVYCLTQLSYANRLLSGSEVDFLVGSLLLPDCIDHLSDRLIDLLPPLFVSVEDFLSETVKFSMLANIEL